MKVSMVVTPEEEKLQKSQFEVTWTDEESGVAKKAKKVRAYFGVRVQSLRKKSANTSVESIVLQYADFEINGEFIDFHFSPLRCVRS